MKRISILLLILLAWFVSAAWPQAEPQCKHKIITFDAPGAGTGAGQGTFPQGIVAGDAVAGYYVDANNLNHGFLRTADGTITTFDAPGAGTSAGQGTTVYGMNSSNAIVGIYWDTNNVGHGFLRHPRGTFTTVDAPGAGTGP